VFACPNLEQRILIVNSALHPNAFPALMLNRHNALRRVQLDDYRAVQQKKE